MERTPKSAQAIAGLEVHKAVLLREPVHADLAGNAAVFRADDSLGASVVQEFGCRIVQPDGLLELEDEAVVLGADDFPVLGREPPRSATA